MKRSVRKHKPVSQVGNILSASIEQLEALLLAAAKDYVAAVQENTGKDSHPEAFRAVLNAKVELHKIGAAWYKAVYENKEMATGGWT